MNGTIEERLDDFARRLRALEAELTELRRSARPAPEPEPEPREWTSPVWASPPPPVEEPPAPAPEPRPRRELTLADLLGARTLAWTGGVVTLLGIVLLFALAVNRGWVGPWQRVGIGALASAIVFGGGFWLRRRYGPTYSALAAVGAGIAGAYATLLAAAALYHLLPDLAALGAAGGIAAVGVATSLAWSAELVAALGLVGAMVVPVFVVFQNGQLSPLGTGFVAIVLAGAGAVAVWRRWRALLVVGVMASAPQIVDVVASAGSGSWRVSTLAGAFALVYLAIGLAEQLSAESPRLDGFAASVVLLSGVVAGGSAIRLFSGDAEGVALLSLAAAYAVPAIVFFRRQRDLSSLLSAVALSLTAIGVADLASGQTVAVAWSAEAAVLAWLAQRIRELRFQLASFVYLALAFGHAFAFDAPPTHLWTATPHPAHGALGVVAVAAAAALVGLFADAQRWVRISAAAVSAVVALYAAALGILALFGFDWGHVAVTSIWAVAGAAVVYAGLRRESRTLALGGLAWLGATVANVLFFDLTLLAPMPRSYASLAEAAVLLAVAVAYRRLNAVSTAAVAISAALAVWATATLVGGEAAGVSLEGLALLALAGVYGGVAVGVFAERDFSTLLWLVALLIAGGASIEVLHGTYLVVGWAATGAALTWVGARYERRLHAASAVYLAAAAAHALGQEAPLSRLFSVNPHPASGVPALLAVAVATAVFAHLAGDEKADYNAQLARSLGAGVAAVAGVYAGSLALLGLFEAVGAGSVQSNFQHGHTAVSAFLGSLGLVALYAGLRRGSRTLRLAGFGIFGASLGKLFLYDLAALSSVAKALSFLAVGALLLLGGFFYQRLAAERDATDGRPG
jgi:uncharacterized membrane protein